MRFHDVMVEEAIGCFGFGPGAASLRKGGGGLPGKVGGECNEPLNQTLIGQRGEGKFVRRPIRVGGVERRVAEKRWI